MAAEGKLGEGNADPLSPRSRRSRSEATSRDSHMSNSEAMYSALVQDLLSKVQQQLGDAHTRSVTILKTNYEHQLQGLRRENEQLQQQLKVKGASVTSPGTNAGSSRSSVGFSPEVETELIEADSLQAMEKNESLHSLDSSNLDIDGPIPGALILLKRNLDKDSKAGRSSELMSGSVSVSPYNMNLVLRSAWTEAQQDEGVVMSAMLSKAISTEGQMMVKRQSSTLPVRKPDGAPRRCGDFVAPPGATWRLCWDLSGAVLIGFDTVMIPFTLAFEPEENLFFIASNWTTMLFWTFDAISTFFTGYVSDTGKTVMSLPLIAKKYFKSWFVLDLVVIMGDWFNNVGEALNSGSEGGVGNTTKMMRSLRVVRVLRLLRLFKLKKMMSQLQDNITSEMTFLFISLVRLLFFILFINHLIACGWYALGRMKLKEGEDNWIQYHKCEHRGLGYRYTTSLHWTLTQFTPAAMEVHPHNTAERTMSVVVLMLALAVFSSLLASINTSMTALRNMNSDSNKQLWMLRRYLKQKKVSRVVGRRILKYLEYVLEKKQGHVQQASISILSMLSEQLWEEMTYELTSPKIYEQLFFQYISAFPLMESVMRKICYLAVKTKLFAAGDHIFFPGDEAKTVHCFINGHMEYFLEELEPIDPPVMEQEWIGEAAFWVPWKYVGRFAARGASELITVDILSFIRHVSTNVLSLKYASRYAEIFVKHFQANLVRSDILRDEVMIDSLMEDLINEHEIHGLGLKMKPHMSGAPMRHALARIRETNQDEENRESPSHNPSTDVVDQARRSL